MLRVAWLLAALVPAAVFAQAPPPPGAAPAAPPGAAPATPPAPAPVPWLPQPYVRLIALDKVSTRVTQLAGKVGQELRYATLTIVARSCFARPPDAPADAAAFLDITDRHPGTEPFHAWMFANDPSISIYQDPLYDIRLVGCAAGP